MIQTIKSILSRPAHSAALFIEIIIVTVIGWIAVEPIAVNTTTAMIPTGYEPEGLVEVSFSYLAPEAEEFDSASYNAEAINKGKDQLLRMLRDRKEVKSATFNSYISIEQSSSKTSYLDADTIFRQKAAAGSEEEENTIQVYQVLFMPGTDFFTTFGIKGTDGTPLTEPSLTEGSFIVTKTLAEAVCPDGSIIGRDLYPYDEEDEGSRHSPIAGIASDISYSKKNGRTAIAFKPENNYGWFYGITIRLAEGVNPRAFIDTFTTEINDYRSGDVYLSDPKLYTDMREELFAEKRRDLSQKWMILAFFLANVLLGVAGNFYVQCKSRIPDAGVMRAFGATRRHVELSLIGEACITVTAGWLIGSIIYLVYLKTQGFPMESDAEHIIRFLQPLWYDTKLGRYSIIGGIILALLLAVATLGAWLPARKVGRVPIVESLRDE